MEAFCRRIACCGTVGPVVLAGLSALMHGTGFVSAYIAMLSGGCVVTVENHHFDPHLVWSAVEKNKVQSVAIVGDPFARPLLAALEEAPGRYDLSSMLAMSSSGAMWTIENKRGLIQHIPQLIITDHFSSTEAMGMGNSIMTKDGEAQTAAFTLLEDAIVIDEHDKPIPPGSGNAGLVALGGPMCMGYYKDPEKTARTIRTIGNVRRSIPGDWARVEADGTITLLGRGNNCINTAGEKVFPEEVEETLKTHPTVEDALVLGVPDEKWGQAVTGVVKLADGALFDEASLREHVRAQLAGYKTPKRIIAATTVNLRAPNGKADYKAATEFARRARHRRVAHKKTRTPEGSPMKFTWFNLMPWPYLPDDFREKNRSVWVDIDQKLFDPVKSHEVYNTYLDLLEYADTLGFDGVGCNEHHQNGYGLMPSPAT